MLTLYDFLPSGNGFKVRLLLSQLGIPFKLVEKDILKGETRTPEFLAINPDGRIPTLVFEDGRRLAQSNAIMFYFAEGTLGAVRVGDYKFRFIDQPQGWLGGTVKPDMPILTNLRLDPYERTGLTGSQQYLGWMMYQFWRFVFVQDVVMKFGQSFMEFPPLQKPASFNLDAVKEQLKAAAHHAAK